jgi:CMP-N-acetylneuraminic acid synthetase
VMDPAESVDIDEPADFEYAEYLVKQNENR